MGKLDLYDIISGYKTISIIGMDKNAGKTTVLNYLLKRAKGINTLGLTSIGMDGEDKDVVTATEKPRIYVEKGTIIATAKQCLFNSDITKEILKTTSMNTPLGEVVISRALSDGYVELGGPSTNSLIAKICSELEMLGSNLILVDGALGRKTFASPSVTEGTILATGASLSKSMDKVVEKTAHAVKLLSIPKIEDKGILEICNSVFENSRIGMINKGGGIVKLDALIAMDSSREIVDNISENTEYIFLRGIISDRLIEDIMKCTNKYSDVTFLAEDGTKLFLSSQTLNKFEKQGGVIKVINPIKILCVTCNPVSPYGYEFKKDKFLNKLRENIDLPVFDVVGGN